MAEDDSIIKGILKRPVLTGALSGALGGVVMKALVRFIDRNAFGLSAQTDGKTAHELWRRLHWEPLTDKQAEGIGAAMHYGFAVLAGAAYAASAENLPVIRAGRGVVFGVVLWLIGDEIAVSVAGLEKPFRTPIRSHCSALSAHVVYGMIVDALAKSRGCVS